MRLSMAKLKEKYPYSALNVMKRKHLDYEKEFPIQNPISMLNNNYVGIEVEVENARAVILSHLWKMTLDGSLRNNGKELVSLPLAGPGLVEGLNQLKEYINNINLV